MFVLSACENTPSRDPSQVGYQGTGQVLEYHPNGKLKREADFVDGQLVSEVVYFASGVKASEEMYLGGKLDTAIYYFESGRVRTKVGG